MIRLPACAAAIAIAASLYVPASAGADTPRSPYAGEQHREIKALSHADIADLMEGRGWGLARPAELNGYPGPVHLLEMREQIALTEAQQRDIRALFDDMQARARRIGADYVAAEQRLDAAFSERTVDPRSLAALVRETERLRADLRLVHLEAHLRTLPLLTRHQAATYTQLRGYGGSSHGTGQGGHRH